MPVCTHALKHACVYVYGNHIMISTSTCMDCLGQKERYENFVMQRLLQLTSESGITSLIWSTHPQTPTPLATPACFAHGKDQQLRKGPPIHPVLSLQACSLWLLKHVCYDLLHSTTHWCEMNSEMAETRDEPQAVKAHRCAYVTK